MTPQPVYSPEKEQFQQFVAAHETAVFTFCTYMLGSQAAAEAVAQAAFVSTYPSDGRLGVLAAAYQRCLHHPLSRHPHHNRGIQQLYNQLAPETRALIALRYGCHLQPTEIASITGLTVTQVRQNLYLARYQLASILPETTGSPDLAQLAVAC